MDPLILRDTDVARDWLHQFNASDRSTASLLIETLELVSLTALHQSLKSLLDEPLTRKDGSTALFAIRECEGPYFPPDQPDERPLAVARGGGVGSEGHIANLIRDIARSRGGHVLDHPSIIEMRSTKCGQIILLDDLIGSGKRARGFVSAFYNHPTIRSWHSLDYVDFSVMAYAATRNGKRRVERHPRVDRVLCDRALERGRRIWNPAEREAIESVCRKYAPKTSRPYWPLGFEDAFTSVVFEHKCPNTAPAILWAGSKIWRPLFQNRPQLEFSTWPQARSVDEQQERMLKVIGQQKLSLGAWKKHLDPQGRLRLIILAAISKRVRKVERLSELAEISMRIAERLRRECVELGWVTWEYDMTPRGRAELEYARDIEIIEPLTFNCKKDFYFPRSLRARGLSSVVRRLK